jgi:hypothetical protein
LFQTFDPDKNSTSFVFLAKIVLGSLQECPQKLYLASAGPKEKPVP